MAICCVISQAILGGKGPPAVPPAFDTLTKKLPACRWGMGCQDLRVGTGEARWSPHCAGASSLHLARPACHLCKTTLASWTYRPPVAF